MKGSTDKLPVCAGTVDGTWSLGKLWGGGGTILRSPQGQGLGAGIQVLPMN